MHSSDRKSWDFSPVGFARVLLITLIGTLGTMGVALAAVSYTTRFMDAEAATLTFAAAVAIPLLVSGPILYFFASKLRENALMHRQLAWIASQDSLTTCLNRGAFITLVDVISASMKQSAWAGTESSSRHYRHRFNGCWTRLPGTATVIAARGAWLSATLDTLTLSTQRPPLRHLPHRQ